MYYIIKLGLWLKLTDKQIDFLVDKYLKIRYGVSLKESIKILSEKYKD